MSRVLNLFVGNETVRMRPTFQTAFTSCESADRLSCPGLAMKMGTKIVQRIWPSSVQKPLTVMELT